MESPYCPWNKPGCPEFLKTNRICRMQRCWRTLWRGLELGDYWRRGDSRFILL